MASTKPRKIKDLKARLGKTIAPNTETAEVAPPSGIVPPGASSAPSEPALDSRPAAAVLAPPPGIAPSSAPGIVAPPFAQPKAAPKPTSGDPFAAVAAPAAGPQEVRIVIDDSAVESSTVGRSGGKGKLAAILGFAGIIGILLGYFSGGMMGERKLHNRAVTDAQGLRERLSTATDRVNEAKRHIDAALESAQGESPSVNVAEIQALAALEKPLSAADFARRTFIVWEESTVDALFTYNSQVEDIWRQIESLNSFVAGEQRLQQIEGSSMEQELNQGAEALAAATSLTGCIVSVVENRYMCTLGFVDIPEGSQGEVKVRQTRLSRTTQDKTLYPGEGDLSSGDFTILVNTGASVGVLGEQSRLWVDYLQRLAHLKALLERAVQTQDRLEQGVNDVAANETLFVL